jgi:hypothetical protein
MGKGKRGQKRKCAALEADEPEPEPEPVRVVENRFLEAGPCCILELVVVVFLA